MYEGITQDINNIIIGEYYKREKSKNEKNKNGGWFPTIFEAYKSK